MGRLDVFRRAELERRGDEIYTASFISPMDTRRYIADACVFGGEAAFPGMPCFHSFCSPPPPFFFSFSPRLRLSSLKASKGAILSFPFALLGAELSVVLSLVAAARCERFSSLAKLYFEV